VSYKQRIYDRYVEFCSMAFPPIDFSFSIYFSTELQASVEDVLLLFITSFSWGSGIHNKFCSFFNGK